jgi:carbamoylphosphate synthase large subunit
MTAFAENTHEYELVEFILPFFKKYPWEGPVEVEIIIDERVGKPKIIEINPRFAGSISFPIQCGVNFPYIACMAALNRKPESPPCYNKGMFYINYSFYLKAVSKEYHIAENKSEFFYKVFKELKKKKVSNYPDKKDLFFYFVKAGVQILK